MHRNAPHPRLDDTASAPPAPDFRALFEAVPGAVLVLLPDAPRFTIVAGTDAYLRATLLTRHEVLGRAMFDVFPDANPGNPDPTGVANLRASLERVLATGAPDRMADQRYDLRRPDGGWAVRYWAPLNTPVHGEDGTVRYILHFVEDVTARVLAGEATARAERLAARTLERIGEGYVALDDAFRFVAVNPAAERILGKSREQLLGRTHWELFPASLDAETGRAYRRVAAEGVALHLAPHYTGEGYDLHLEIDAYPTDEGASDAGGRGVAVFFRDVTDRARAEAALQESERRFRALVQATSVFFYRMSADWSAMRQLTGGGFIPDTTAPRTGWLETYIDPRDREPVMAAVREAIHTRSVFELEHRVLRADGRPGWVLSRAVPILAPDGDVVEWFGAATDVTARKEAEEELRASEERYRLIVEGARNHAILTTDPEGRITSWSPGAEAVFGWSPAEAVGRMVDMTFVPEDRATGEPTKERAQAREHGSTPNVRWHQRRDGRRVFIEGTARALRDDTGQLRGFFKIGQDVTQRRETDEALRASEARFRTLVENVRDYAIFLLDADGAITEWTSGAERVTGWPAADVVGRHTSVLYAPEDVAAGEVARDLAEVLATGRVEREAWRVRRSGERFWANEVATAVRDGEGRLVGVSKIVRDLTERRLAEEAAEHARMAVARDELRRALAAAEEAERQRLARELHDQLGQHLSALALGLAEARRRLDTAAGAETPPSSEPRTSELTAILGRLEELAGLLTRDARTLALDLRPPELDDVGIASAIETYVAAWSARSGVAAQVAVTGQRDRVVPADVGSALYRIAQEALTNVARHAQATRVSVVIENAERELGLIIEDNGRGFDPDTTAERVRRERRLGLAGMRERAALVGGSVAVEASPGAGTTVFARLPIGPADAPRAGRDA